MLMPLWMEIYVLLFIVLVLSNIVFHFKHKVKIVFFLYETFSAIYMILLIIIYWTPELSYLFGFVNIIALLLIISVDFYFTIWGTPEDIGLDIPKMSNKEQEIAKIISILFASPAYIIGLLLSIKFITINYSHLFR
jgi:hypothetical protein